jgi:hypothetical protein
VQGFLIPLLQGLIALFVISGLGRLALRFSGIRNLSWYWNLAFTALAGQALASLFVQAVLLAGVGSAVNLRLLAWLLVGLATAGHLFASRTGAGKILTELFQANKIATAILLLAVLTNLVVALAPSTKIDELYYHMLTPKRIVEDGGLQFYLLPIESTVVPHMDYQITLSVAHAWGAPDAGNILSWGYSVVLFVFVIGYLLEESRNRCLSILCAALCSVGMYATVWHTTGGAHSLGDLATVVALAGVLRPHSLLRAVGPYGYTLLLTTAAALAASTKLSLLPLALFTSVLIVNKAARGQVSDQRLFQVTGLALLPWIVIHVPLMVWTYVASGSFWGPVLANVFGRSVFPAEFLRYADELQAFNLRAIVLMSKYAVMGISPALFVSIPWVLWTALRGFKTSRLVFGLFFLQAGLVVWKFRFDFRFLGGLEYVLIIAAVLSLTNPESTLESSEAWKLLGNRLVRSTHWILLIAAVPWLGLQIYYARPFAEVVTGLMPRNRFMERYVALHSDFEVLDGMLPKDAVLYLAGGRWPSFYAPRPMVLTPLDLHGRAPIYRLALSSQPDEEWVDAHPVLKCGQIVYANEHAVIETYRTPGQLPSIGAIKVQSCQVLPASSGR